MQYYSTIGLSKVSMTLINSEEFHVIINTLGTTVFALTMLLTLWFASKMD